MNIFADSLQISLDSLNEELLSMNLPSLDVNANDINSYSIDKALDLLSHVISLIRCKRQEINYEIPKHLADIKNRELAIV
jgi:hypothetical protein